jgi:virginiamycin B lyase
MSKCSPANLSVIVAVSLFPLAAYAQGSGGLPEGNGKDLVVGICTGCHQTDMITRSSGYTAEHWKELTSTMIDLSGDKATQSTIIQYLAEKFPPNTARASKMVPGPIQVAFKQWQVPTLGQRSRDPVEAPDGMIWWAGQFGNLIGRLNPATGEMKEYRLPPNAKPHTITLDAQGTPWYSGNMNGTIGKVDPATGKVTEYKMPDPKARDPHTIVFDQKGILWFTLQNSNMIGRLDPASGDIKLVNAPVANAKPYGIKIDAAGTPWVSCNGAPCLLKVDPANMAVTEVKLTLPGTTVRRLDIAEDGMIWYVNSGQGRLGRYNPKTSESKEWTSPSGQKSHPYAIAVVNGIVWYNESGVRPDMLVRFDPQTETFQSWPIASGNVYAGIVRHMRPTRDGNLLIHQSSTNRIMLVTVKSRAAEIR